MLSERNFVMIYNFNLGIGWASSGVEYAQIYRARMFRAIGAKAKFIFTDMFPRDNIQHNRADRRWIENTAECSDKSRNKHDRNV